jgi:PAS domain S-box-containing protein
MFDPRKTKTELLEELAQLHLQLADLQEREATHRATEAALQMAKDANDILIDSSLDMIISVDVERRIIEFNAAAERTFGYQRAEVLGKSIDLLYANPVLGQHVHTVTQQEGKFIGEIVNRRKNGETFPSYLSASPMKNAEGILVGFMGISRDISDRKQLEQQRTEFLAMLTHDIKKPLSSILACTEMVLEGIKAYGLTEEEALLEQLRSCVTTIDSLVTNHLDFSRIEAGSLSLIKGPLSIDRVLQRIRQQYETEARRRRIRLEIISAPESLEVEGDMLALERILANLVHNALKFTPPEGAIQIRTMQQGQTAVIKVKDTGPGIAPKDQPLLFEKYRHPSVSRQQEGTGLGLAIVKALIEAHHGRVEMESIPGQGACFILSLPLLFLKKRD